MNNTNIVNYHFRELDQKYPGLQLIKQGNGSWLVVGLLSFSAQYTEQIIDDEYKIEIFIPPEYPGYHPSARETGNRIPLDFHHSDNYLCLGEPGEVIQKFQDEPTLLGFTEKCLIPYLYNFSYKALYGVLPFGELSHGWLGILEHYQDVFQIKDRKAVLALLKACTGNCYNGHVKCPCGRKRRLRRCHGDTLRRLIADVPNRLLRSEYDLLIKNLGFNKKQ